MSASSDRLDYSLMGLGGGGSLRELWVLSVAHLPSSLPFLTCLSHASLEWMLFFPHSRLCWCPLLFIGIQHHCGAAGGLLRGFHSDLCPWTVCSPAWDVCRPVVMYCFPMLGGRETLWATLNSEDSTGLRKLTHLMSQASELNKECS